MEFNVSEQDFATLGQALIKTLADVLGRDMTFEIKIAWTLLYEKIKDGIIGDTYSEYNRLKLAHENIGLRNSDMRQA